MAASPIEDAIRFMGELAEACRDDDLAVYVEKYVGSADAQREAFFHFDRAKEALKVLADLGEFLHNHVL